MANSKELMPAELHHSLGPGLGTARYFGAWKKSRTMPVMPLRHRGDKLVSSQLRLSAKSKM
jgi:hypothetical protein